MAQAAATGAQLPGRASATFKLAVCSWDAHEQERNRPPGTVDVLRWWAPRDQ